MQKKLNIHDLKCISIYLLIYSGAIKLMFPNLDTVVKIVQLFMVFLCVVIILSPQEKPVFLKSAILPMILQVISFAIMLLTALYSPNAVGATIRGRSIILTLLHMVLIFCISLGINDKYVDKIERVIIIGNVILLLSYFLLNLGTILSGLQNGFRLGDSVGNPIWISRVCGDTMLCIFLRNRRTRKISYTILLMVICIINLLTISKGPIIAMVVAFLYYYEKTDKRAQKKIVRNGLLVLFFLL